MFIVGIDVAKRNHEVVVITSEGDIVCKPFSITNNCSGYNRMTERLSKLTNQKSEFIFAMESTAHYWQALCTHLRKDGYNTVLLNPIQTFTMREMFLRKTKTDSKDSFVIAEVIRFGRYIPSNVSQEKLLALKELCRNRTYLMDMASDLKRKAVSLMDRIFPEYESQFSSLFGKTSIAVLLHYPTPKRLASAQLSRLTSILLQSSNGRFGEWKARQLKELAKNSFGVDDTEGAYSTLILMVLRQIQELLEKCTELEVQIDTLLQQFDTKLTTIPGIGPTLAATILSEIGDISRFSSADKLAAYMGVDPSVNSSGEFVGGQCPYVQAWFLQPAASHLDGLYRCHSMRPHVQGVL